MRVLVTGGSGFIGSHVVDRLAEAGHEPVIFDRLASPHHGREVATRLGDLLDRPRLTQAMHGCDAVVHLAAMADVDVVAKQPEQAESVNSRGTLNVLEAARAAGVERVVYASTIWVYSSVDADAVDEGTQLGLPEHLYTATKLAGEMYCRSYEEMYGLRCTVLRFGIPYGPRARPEAVVPIFVSKALAGEALTLAGGGTQSRRFVYVEDLADGVVRGLDRGEPGRTYNLVSEEDVTIAEVAETVREVVGDTEVVYGPGRSADFAGAHVSGTRAAEELGWRASTPFRTGVRRYVDWHRAQALLPEPVPHPRLAVPSVGRLARFGALAAAMAGVSLMLGLLLETLHRAGADGDDLRTVLITSMIGLAVCLTVAPDPDRREQLLLTIAWITAGILLLVVIPGPHDALHLDGSRPVMLIQGVVGGGFGLVAGLTSRRLVAGRPRERPSDSAG